MQALRMGVWGGAASVVAYAGCCLYMFARQAKLLYQFEQKEDPSHLPSAPYPFSSLQGWVDNEGQEDAMLYFGGSSESVQLRRAIMGKMPFTRYFLPYRGFWPNNHLQPSEGVIKQDALDLFDHAKARHRHVYVVGRSLGTSMAMHVAANRPVQALTLITPFDSIINLAKQKYKMFPVQKILKDWHETHKDAPRVQVPTMVFLAEKDCVTPHASWNALKQSLSCPLTACTLPNTDHTNIVQQTKLWDDLQDFLRAHA